MSSEVEDIGFTFLGVKEVVEDDWSKRNVIKAENNHYLTNDHSSVRRREEAEIIISHPFVHRRK